MGPVALPARETAVSRRIAPTAFIAPTAVVLGDVTLGSHASVWYHAVLRGDMAPIVIGEATNIQDGTIVHVDEGKPALIGARVGVGHRVILHGCTVEDECLIGMGSVLLNGVRIGTGSVVAAGAVVPEGMLVPPGSLVMGVPARVVRPVDEALRARIRDTWEHYVVEAARHRGGAFPLERPSL
jgi:carbonic anhydrase/acetyltransferase-like protein (isoleucine patch superfamily)